ncbi:MAG: radical SAM protein [Bacteroidota bacterium]|nr:radical SAM protein [Bacteroidota bacterium]
MLDHYNRDINYLRISVTDRCNLRCRYCMPEEGVKLLNHNDILSYEEITVIARAAVNLGFHKFRITGGEPLVRKGVVDLVRMLSAIPGVEDLSMTSNGTLLSEYATTLKKEGLQRINISLDTVDPDRYAFLTRGGDLKNALEGIIAARDAGLDPVKINCVIKTSSDEPDAQAVTEYCKRNGLAVRFIQQMSLGLGKFAIVDGGSGGDCTHCNRLRLTANGIIKPCLFNNAGYDVRTLGVEEALKQAIRFKPESGSVNTLGSFYNIGG